MSKDFKNKLEQLTNDDFNNLKNACITAEILAPFRNLEDKTTFIFENEIEKNYLSFNFKDTIKKTYESLMKEDLLMKIMSQIRIQILRMLLMRNM